MSRLSIIPTYCQMSMVKESLKVQKLITKWSNIRNQEKSRYATILSLPFFVEYNVSNDLMLNRQMVELRLPSTIRSL